MALFVNRILAKANRLLAAGRGAEAFKTLRRLSIEQFGRLLLDVPERFEALRAALPEMPSEKTQRDWTGNAGQVLLAQTCAFVRSVEAGFVSLCGRPLRGATILDYGCGWGRVMRLMYLFSDPENVHGIDPDEAALEICRTTRVRGHLARCDHVPRELPFPGVTFDLVYAFSVFTHLSESTAGAVVRAVRRRISPDGLFVLTVRPVEYWPLSPWVPADAADAMRRRHAEEGLAFFPLGFAPVEGEVTYGEASIGLDYIRRTWKEWELKGHETSVADPYQLVLFLRPR